MTFCILLGGFIPHTNFEFLKNGWNLKIAGVFFLINPFNTLILYYNDWRLPYHVSILIYIFTFHKLRIKSWFVLICRGQFFHFYFFYLCIYWFWHTILLLVTFFLNCLLLICTFSYKLSKSMRYWLTNGHETRVHWPTAGVHRLSLWWLALRATK